MPSTYTSKNPQYTRASGIFKADSFTVYKLNISHLCDGACEGTSEWTMQQVRIVLRLIWYYGA